MSVQRTFWYSQTWFRVDPTQPGADDLFLGYILGFRTERAWVVGMAMRARIDPDVEARLDILSREMIEARSEIFQSEIGAVIEACTGPEQALQMVASRNPFSMNVTVPVSRVVDLPRSLDAASFEKLTEEYLITICEHVPVPSERELFSYNNISETAPIEDIPSPWMLAPKLVWRASC